MEDRIISVLIGLIGACSNNPKTPETDGLILKALAFPALCPEADETALQKLVDRLYAEKYAISPGCAECAFPCGNTSDYDMSRIHEAEDEIRDIKLQILSRLQNLAAYVCRCQEQGREMELDGGFLCKALSLVSYDLEKEPLQALLEETECLGKYLGMEICTEDTGHDKKDHQN